ncbi:squalene cyclase [Paenibacillus pasadenensis]|uniref:prenyltransferase/squalene oxidase repeat-containing protein n=1 Tax=Paenibacillus pasadenensis TaxID=217090 RepID=UPI00203F5856|nr:prenyltransferase/squalene oxidase repeat-containing protein [Paenibacillus pasadenensis]MCM3748062.1 squalene cyclase [Paenibacillus pasadenensis]
MTDLISTAAASALMLQQELLERQSPDGSWRLCCESGVMSDAFLLILLQSIGPGEQDQELIRRISARIASMQQEDGSWRLYADQREGHLESSVEAYYALLACGTYRYGDPALVKARRFILSKGGLGEVRAMMTQVLLAMTGQLPWPKALRIPVESLLAPSWLPLSLFDLSGHARAHLVPVLMLSSGGYKLGAGKLPVLQELIAGEERSFRLPPLLPEPLSGILEAMSSGHSPLYPSSLKRAERYMAERIEPNGTLLTYSTSTILMIAALLSIGYKPDHETIVRGLDGIRSLVWQYPHSQLSHLQIADSTVWDTAMIGSSLFEHGMAAGHPPLQSAARFLAARQQSEAGDWKRRNPDAAPGGWGFSSVNTRYPDVDDSAAALLFLQRAGKGASYWSSEAQERGGRWIWSMQNGSGGWPAFERESGSPLIGLIQFEQSAQIVTDPPTVDLTARTLQWASQAGAPLPSWLASALHAEDGSHPGMDAIEKASKWILSQQTRSGSWLGRWGIAHVHGTGSAMSGLLAVKAPKSASALYRGMQWLLSVQNEDGGWGESCSSDVDGIYRPLGASTPSQTAWALEGLLAHPNSPQPSIDRGIACLCSLLEANDWRSVYPAGGAFPGHVYLNYESSRYIWPLRVLAQYQNRYAVN